MNIIILGAEGQLAKKVAEQFVTDNVMLVNKKMLSLHDEISVLNFISQQSPHVVINCAAYTNVEQAEVEPSEAYRTNGLGAKNLALVCKRCSIPLIHISSDYVFDGKKHLYSETDTVNPLNEYGKSKAMGDQYIADICEKYIIFRTSWLFSEYGNNFLKTMLKASKNNVELKIVDDQIGHPTYTGHLAIAINQICRKIMNESFDDWGIYNFGGEPSTSWFEFAKVIFSKAKQAQLINTLPVIKPIKTNDYPFKANRPLNTKMSMTKTSMLLSTPFEWEKGIDETLSFLKREEAKCLKI